LAVLLAVLLAGHTSTLAKLTGEWSAETAFDSEEVPALTFSSELSLSCSLEQLSVIGGASIEDDSLASIFVQAALTMDLWDFSGMLSFGSTGFQFSQGVVGLTLGSVYLRAVAHLGESPADAALEYTMAGPVGDLIYSLTTRLRGCDMAFSTMEVRLEGPLPFCQADYSGTISLDCDGFSKAVVEVSGISLPGMDWATLDTQLVFRPDEKTLVVSPSFDLGVATCFDVYFSDPQGLFGEVAIDGVGIVCDIGGVTLRGISYWGDSAKPDLLADTPYWEAYQVSTSDPACCGPLAFRVAIYFQENGELLFDVAAVRADLALALSEQLEMEATLDLALSPAHVEGSLRFTVDW
jgi:hypothetical protein